jgi:8-amino-7-oxononanoate synthase
VVIRSLAQEVEELDRRGLVRSPRLVARASGPGAEVDGQEVLLFCSNDYLGLSRHPVVVEAARRALERHGAGSCSSRLVCGSAPAHRDLEQRLAAWLGVDRALLFPAGFLANLAVLTVLVDRRDVVFSDELNHASIVQGCRLSGARIVVFPHRDAAALGALMAELCPGARRALVVTESLFSVDGDEAPLRDLAVLAARHEAALVVDEAHAFGVLGPGGKGLSAEAGIRPDVLVGTLGKAFGAAGAFVAGSGPLARLVESRAKPYIYTTALPPVMAAAAAAALELVQEGDDLRARLRSRSARLRSGVARLGCAVPSAAAHIVPTLVPGAERVMRASALLLERGIFVQGLRPPTVPPGTERLRFAATAEHTDEQVDLALRGLAEVLEELGPARPEAARTA